MGIADIEERLNKMKNVDIRTVDKEKLVDIRMVIVDNTLPLQDRILDFIEKLDNPYCFRVGDVVVKVEYEDTDVTFEQRFEKLLLNT